MSLGSLFIFCRLRMYSLQLKKLLQRAETKLKKNHDPIRSGVSASMDSNAVWTFPVQLSSRSRKDLICWIPRTLGCTQETCTVPSTWSIIPSIRWTCNKRIQLQALNFKTVLSSLNDNKNQVLKCRYSKKDISNCFS